MVLFSAKCVRCGHMIHRDGAPITDGTSETHAAACYGHNGYTESRSCDGVFVSIMGRTQDEIRTVACTYTLRHEGGHMDLYNDGKKIGTTSHTESEWKAMSQQPEGLIRLGALPHDSYDLMPEYQGLHEDTAVYAARVSQSSGPIPPTGLANDQT